MITRWAQNLFRLMPLWLRPQAELARLIKMAHLGEVSVEELVAAPVSRGRRMQLVAVIADLLLDLKQQRAERAALEQEIRDRIANRTDALERKIGTLQLQATRDGLTGLGNRRGLDVDLPRMIQVCKSSGTELCLLMIDVDHFKQLNDTLGHAAGDVLLREIAQLIRSNLRDLDHAYRAGGDEFVILTQSSSSAAGASLAERLSCLVRVLTRPLKVASPPQISIGVAVLSELKEQTAQQLLQAADQRLYQVKSLRPQSRASLRPSA